MINIRKGKKEDLPHVLKLIKELAEYENALDEVLITLNDLEQDGFGSQPWYSFLVAEKNKKIIGLAFYFMRYSTWKGKFLFLEDFIIHHKYRRAGVGSALFAKTVEICQKLELNGMCWQVLDWNKPAIRFYEKHGAKIDNSWLNGRFSKKQINAFNVNVEA